MKWFLHVQMDISIAFFLCMCGGTNWNDTDFCISKVLGDYEASFSSQCVSDFIQLLDDSSWTFFVGAYNLFYCSVLKGFSDDYAVVITL